MKKFLLFSVLLCGISVAIAQMPTLYTKSLVNSTGFYGQCSVILGTDVPFNPNYPSTSSTNNYRAYISVYNDKGKLVNRISTNPFGQFYETLKLGNYTLIASEIGAKKLPPVTLSALTNWTEWYATQYGNPPDPIQVSLTTNAPTAEVKVVFLRHF